MAPTAILASQHLESFEAILKDFGIKCELLIGSVTKKKKEEMLEISVTNFTIIIAIVSKLNKIPTRKLRRK